MTSFHDCSRLWTNLSIDGVNTYFVAKAARELGLKAALSGIGGDELFGGYPSFSQVPMLARWLGRFGSRRLGRAVRTAVSPLLGKFTSTKYAGLLEYGGTYGGAYLLRRGLFMPWEITKVLGPRVCREGLEQLGIESRLESTVNGLTSPWSRVSALELVWYMRNQLLRDADWAGMAHSIEIRTPLADIEVLRAVAPIAAAQRLMPHKGDLPLLPKQPLPAAIVDRKKTGFAVPMRQWIPQTDASHNGHEHRRWGRRLAREFNLA